MRGVFKGPCKDDYYLKKAARNPDDYPHEPLYDPKMVAKEEAPPATIPVPKMSMGELRAACKAAGINSFGMKKADMAAKLDNA